MMFFFGEVENFNINGIRRCLLGFCGHDGSFI